MKLETALNSPNTVTQLVKKTGLSRGGVMSYLRRNKSKIKTVGEAKRAKNARGPVAKLYQNREAFKLGKVKALYEANVISPTEATAVLSAPVDANGSPAEATEFINHDGSPDLASAVQLATLQADSAPLPEVPAQYASKEDADHTYDMGTGTTE